MGRWRRGIERSKRFLSVNFDKKETIFSKYRLMYTRTVVVLKISLQILKRFPVKSYTDVRSCAL